MSRGAVGVCARDLCVWMEGLRSGAGVGDEGGELAELRVIRELGGDDGAEDSKHGVEASANLVREGEFEVATIRGGEDVAEMTVLRLDALVGVGNRDVRGGRVTRSAEGFREALVHVPRRDLACRSAHQAPNHDAAVLSQELGRLVQVQFCCLQSWESHHRVGGWCPMELERHNATQNNSSSNN